MKKCTIEANQKVEKQITSKTEGIERKIEELHKETTDAIQQVQNNVVSEVTQIKKQLELLLENKTDKEMIERKLKESVS